MQTAFKRINNYQRLKLIKGIEVPFDAFHIENKFLVLFSKIKTGNVINHTRTI